MVDLNQKIGGLKKKLDNLSTLLKQTSQKVKELESKNHSQIIQKEKELEEWRNKLEVCQQERNQIKKEIREKVQELEQSNLTNTEKQSKINKLLTEHSTELDDLDKLLYEERSQYRSIRDKVISKLCEPCQVCLEKEKRINNLQIWSFLLFLASVFNFLLFLYAIFHKKKKKNRVLLCPCHQKRTRQ